MLFAYRRFLELVWRLIQFVLEIRNHIDELILASGKLGLGSSGVAGTDFGSGGLEFVLADEGLAGRSWLANSAFDDSLTSMITKITAITRLLPGRSDRLQTIGSNRRTEAMRTLRSPTQSAFGFVSR